jgi:hypothetical protein
MEAWIGTPSNPFISSLHSCPNLKGAVEKAKLQKFRIWLTYNKWESKPKT